MFSKVKKEANKTQQKIEKDMKLGKLNEEKRKKRIF